MNKKFFALLIMIVIASSSCAFGASRKTAEPVYKGRNIPSDPTLPSYDNPQEIDIKVKKKDKMHISFKGAFRGIDDAGRLTDWVYFAFTAKAQKDMYLAVGQSELFDSRSVRYKYFAVPDIGNEKTFGRTVIAGLEVPVLVGVNMPVNDAGEFPSVSQITIKFNDKAFQFRNIVTEEWETWEALKQELGL